MALFIFVIAMRGWLDSRQPPPARESLLRDTGTVAGVRPVYRRGRLSRLLFTARESGRRYDYRRYLGQLDLVRHMMIPGRRVTVYFTDPARPQIWEVLVDGNVIVSQQDTASGRRQNGLFALIVAAASGAGAIWFGVLAARKTE